MLFSNLSPSSLVQFHLLLLVVGTAFLILPATATDHIVGANKGWNPGINYTLWANNQTFFVGDYISFRYKRFEYNVFEVNKTGYENCNIEGATGNWSYGKDFVHLFKPGRYYFICGTGGCASGMKVSIVVHSLPPAPSASITATKHSSDSSKHASAASEENLGRLSMVVLRSLLVGLVSTVLTGL